MPSSVEYVREEHLLFVRRAVTYLALGILGGGRAAMEVGEGWYGCRGGCGLVFEKVGLKSK